MPVCICSFQQLAENGACRAAGWMKCPLVAWQASEPATPDLRGHLAPPVHQWHPSCAVFESEPLAGRVGGCLLVQQPEGLSASAHA